MNSRWLSGLMMGIAALAAANDVWAGAKVQPKTIPNPLASRYDAVVIRGKDLGELMGADLEAFQLFAVNAVGELAQIPFQIDERFDSGELVLIPNKLPGTGRLTRQDELVFMARDAGFKIPNLGLLPSSSASREIEISDSGSGEKAWVYAVVSPIPSFRTPVSYVQYDAADRRVSGKSYLLHFPGEGQRTNTPFWQADSVSLLTRAQPGHDSFSLSGNLLQRDLLDIQLGAAGNFLSWQLSGADLDVKEVGQHAGPVRAIRKIRLHPKLGYGLRSSPVTLEQNFFDRYMTLDVSGDGGGLGVLSKADVTFGEEIVEGGVLAQEASDLVKLTLGEQQAMTLWRFSSETTNLNLSTHREDCNRCVLVRLDGKTFPQGRFHISVQRFFSERADDNTQREFLKMSDQPLRVRSKTIEQNLVLRLQ